jgi:phage/plasmid-associated DNA primase
LTATKDHQVEQDFLGTFLAEQCAVGPDHHFKAGGLYAAYKEWREQTGEGLWAAPV